MQARLVKAKLLRRCLVRHRVVRTAKDRHPETPIVKAQQIYKQQDQLILNKEKAASPCPIRCISVLQQYRRATLCRLSVTKGAMLRVAAFRVICYVCLGNFPLWLAQPRTSRPIAVRPVYGHPRGNNSRLWLGM